MTSLISSPTLTFGGREEGGFNAYDFNRGDIDPLVLYPGIPRLARSLIHFIKDVRKKTNVPNGRIHVCLFLGEGNVR